MEWMKKNCDRLTGGAGGSAATRRLRKQKTEENTKVASLFQMFKEFVNKSGGADLEPLKGLLAQLNMPKPRKKKRQKQTQISETAKDTKVWKGHVYHVCPKTGWWTWTGPAAAHEKADAQASKWSADWPELPKQERPQSQNPAKTNHVQRAVFDSRNMTRVPRQNSVTGVRPQDWQITPAPKLVKYTDLERTLSAGENPTGNLAEIQNAQQLDEIKDLWDAFGAPAPLTLLLTGGVQHPDQTKVTISLLRGAAGQRLETVGLLKLGEKKGPWVHCAEKVTKDLLPTSEKIEVRLVAPATYRAQYLPEGHATDSATFVVSSIAAASQVPVSQLTGGQWVQRQQGAASHLVGYLRLKHETVAKLLPHSGSNAVFVNKVNDRSGGPVFWIKRLADETREAYFRRVTQLRKERQQVIIWRQGGGQDLGFGRLPQDEKPTPSRIVAIRGFSHSMG